MSIRVRFFIVALLLGTLAAPAGHSSSLFPEDQVEEFRLDNGMTFLLMPHGETPVFSAYIRYRVGGMDEPPGMTGVAHVIEHMAFKGTQTWGTRDWAKEQEVLKSIEQVGQKLAKAYAAGKRGPQLAKLQQRLDELYEEHRRYNDSEALTREYQRRGGLQMNATTGQDVTTYFISLPSSELNFWAEAESERLFHPVFREFYRERDVVLEERRMRVVDDPGGAFYQELLEKAFLDSPYSRPTIGYKDDLMTLTRTKAEEFFKTYYRPDLAVGAIVGRFDLKKVKRLLKDSFGKIPPVSTPLPVADKVPEAPLSRQGCRVDMQRPAQSRLAVVYHKPAIGTRDDYVFDVIATILSEDRYARLYRSLVLEKGLAVSVDAYPGIPGSRLPNLFMIYAIPRNGVPLDRLREEIENELNSMVKEVVSDEELERARKHLISSQVWRLSENASLAADLSYFQSIAGDWRYLVGYSDVIADIEAPEIQSVAKKYFTAGNRCLGFLHGAPKS